MSARLTPEQAKFAEEYVRGTLPAYDGSVDGIRAHADALRIQHEYGKSNGVNSFIVFSMVADLARDLKDENAALRARAEQAERDRAVLAAEVKAWRRFDNQCSVRDQIVYTADSRPTHPADTMKATDSSGALTRATPAEGGDA